MGSSKLKISNIVDYGWEHKYYPGHLVATHNSGDYFAYGKTSILLRSGSLFGCFQKTQGRAGKNSSPILGKKLKILESTQNFVQKSKGNLTFKDPLLQG